jgi:nitroreductase
MVRAFSPEPLEADLVDRLLADALRAPSAGNTQGAELVVLTGPDETARYWDASLPAERRSTFAWPDLPAAPVLVVVLTDAQRYAERYAEDDKGQDASAWATPYWWVDGGMVVQRLLAGVEEAGLGALFFGVFEQEAAVRTALSIPAGLGIVGVVALGHPLPSRPGRSAGRPRREDRVHRGGYTTSG